jgi:hypothetical protein
VRSGEYVKTLSGHCEVLLSVSFSPDGNLLASGSGDKTVKLWHVSTGTETSAQQVCDAIIKKDCMIEEQKTLIKEKNTRIEEQRVLIEELEGKSVHVVAPSSLSSLSSLSSTIQCCFHEHAKVRIRMLKMEEIERSLLPVRDIPSFLVCWELLRKKTFH